MDILKCGCGGYIDFDTNSFFANGTYGGACEDCKKEHRGSIKDVDNAIWNYNESNTKPA